MKSINIKPPVKPVKVSINLPLSKSISNRMLVIGYLAGDTESVKIPEANDSKLMKALIGRIHQETVFDAKDAGTVFRFLTALFAVTPGERIITGTDRMMQRPVGPLVDALRHLGAKITYLGTEGFPPLKIKGKELSGGMAEIDGSMSSQFISALLMIAPYLKQGLHLKLTGNPVSRPYIEMTAKLMELCGINIETGISEILILPGRYTLNPDVYEADWSAASYWFEMASLQTDSEITLRGLKPDSFQGDSLLTGLFEKMGVKSKWHNNDLIINHTSESEPNLQFDLTDNPDLAPAIAATCAAKGAHAVLTGLSGLVIKESNRLATISQNLQSLGFTCEISNNQSLVISIRDTSLINNNIKTFNDHRIAMAMSILCLKCGPLVIDDMDVTNKSYPEFWNDLSDAGFGIEYIHD